MRKLKEKNLRKLIKIGTTSLSVTIPKEITNSLRLKAKQKVVVKRVTGGVLIKDWRKK